jgi:thiol-disulfide isomerase/thioredoxin
LGNISRIDGGKLDTSGLSGKVVLADFWATWCIPCIKEIPGFNQLQKEYQANGLVVIGIHNDEEGADLIKPFLQKHPMEYMVGHGSPELAKKYSVEEMPVTILFDRSGKEVKRFVGLTPETEIEAAVKAVL